MGQQGRTWFPRTRYLTNQPVLPEELPGCQHVSSSIPSSSSRRSPSASCGLLGWDRSLCVGCQLTLDLPKTGHPPSKLGIAAPTLTRTRGSPLTTPHADASAGDWKRKQAKGPGRLQRRALHFTSITPPTVNGRVWYCTTGPPSTYMCLGSLARSNCHRQ